VQRVTVLDAGEHVMEVVVEDKQLSLAIGKKGQNVRLAAKITGWKIDIKSEEEKRREVEAQFFQFDQQAAEAAAAEQAQAGQPSEEQGAAAAAPGEDAHAMAVAGGEPEVTDTDAPPADDVRE
jgi:N utilization substance protein A